MVRSGTFANPTIGKGRCKIRSVFDKPIKGEAADCLMSVVKNY